VTSDGNRYSSAEGNDEGRPAELFQPAQSMCASRASRTGASITERRRRRAARCCPKQVEHQLAMAVRRRRVLPACSPWRPLLRAPVTRGRCASISPSIVSLHCAARASVVAVMPAPSRWLAFAPLTSGTPCAGTRVPCRAEAGATPCPFPWAASTRNVVTGYSIPATAQACRLSPAHVASEAEALRSGE
jgi:hypothetical protein